MDLQPSECPDRHQDRCDGQEPGQELICIEPPALPLFLERYGNRTARFDFGVAPEEEELAGTLPLLVGRCYHRPLPVSILDDPACLIESPFEPQNLA